MSFLSTFSTIFKDIEAGIALAAPIVGTFAPNYGKILTEVGAVLDKIPVASMSPEHVSQVVQAAALVSHVVSAEPVSTTITGTVSTSTGTTIVSPPAS